MNVRRRQLRRRRVIVATLLALSVVATCCVSTADAGWFGGKKKNNDRARVERPRDDDNNPASVPFNNTVVPKVVDTTANAAGKPSPSPNTQPANVDLPKPKQTPTPTPPPEKKPFFAPKSELEKIQDRLKEVEKLYEKKRYKKALEDASALISEIRRRGLDKTGSDGKGKDVEGFKEALATAFKLAEKAGKNYDEPFVPTGVTGKTLIFVF